MADIKALISANTSRWEKAKPTRNFDAVAKRLVGTKSHYLSVEAKTGVPWFVIAVIHEREASQDWSRSIAQGDPWNRPSVHVPAGRGPFNSWEDAAVDALCNCEPYAAKNKDWSIGPTLTKLEEYNGLGYAARGKPSPYIWSGTDQYVSGKYVSDGVYDPAVVDHQLGCAGLLMAMAKLDPSISFGKRTTPQPENPKSTPSVSHPATGSIGAFIASLISAILSIFKRK